MDPKGKVALVTGGARRVGKAITLAFAQAGANVVINHTSSAKEAEETCAQARALGVEALAFRADIGNLDDVRAMVNAATARFGSVDILVNSAAPFDQTPLPTDDFSIWHRVTNMMINGSLYTANAVAPGMIERGEGVIINIVDLFAWEPRRNFAAHSVGKAGMLALTRQLAIDFAPNVRVNAIAPGPVLPPVDYSPKRIEQAAANTLLNRWGTPQDIADAVLFMVRADYITAQVIAVDGGESYGRHK
jgi:NAD(P)-dependent dehydrogenase (short-subunit alcohol dehydrogenase family)